MLLDFGEPELFGEPVTFGETAQLVPSGVLDLNAVRAAVLLAHMLDLTGIINAVTAFGGLCRFQVLHEVSDVLLELSERTEGVYLEGGHKTAVIVAAGRFDAKAEPGQQAAQDFDHDRQAIALIAFAAANRQQGATLAQLAGVGGGTPFVKWWLALVRAPFYIVFGLSYGLLSIVAWLAAPSLATYFFCRKPIELVHSYKGIREGWEGLRHLAKEIKHLLLGK